MVKDKVLSVKDAVHKIQVCLLEGASTNQLLSAGLVLSKSEYQDVVTERALGNICGYPLCDNSLPSGQPQKGHYHISRKENELRDLRETSMYCTSTCLRNSREFSYNFQKERSSTLTAARLKEILKLYDGSSLDPVVSMGKNGVLGFSELKIQEKTDTETGEVSLEEWIGPSNAIDGYVPRRDGNRESKMSNNTNKKGGRQESEPKHSRAQPNGADIMSNDMNFTSVIITQDEYSISKTVPSMKAKETKGKVSVKDVSHQGNSTQMPVVPSGNSHQTESMKCNDHKNVAATDDKISILEDTAGPSQSDACQTEKELYLEKGSASGTNIRKSSLKTSGSKKATLSVTWADEKTDDDRQNHSNYRELKDKEDTSQSAIDKSSEESYRFASAEACAKALTEAAEAVASGKTDVSDAVSAAGMIILPAPHGENEVQFEEDDDVVDIDQPQLKWPPKPGFSNADLFDSEESLYDSPPEGFNLSLSPFSTMFMALFVWISSSSLAYIYGKEESFHEEYLSVNGREYLRKTVMPDGLSSEIKEALAGCLSRALPGLVAELRLPIPISTLEQGMGRLLDTMSFIDPVPALRIKQWQVIVLVFLDALSVSRIPSLTPYMMDRRILLRKVIEGAEMSGEEYEIMKELMIPLGRVPEFSTQSGA